MNTASDSASSADARAAQSEFADLVRQTINLGAGCEASGDVPVGALVIDPSGAIIGRGRNEREIAPHDPTAHAEIVALREAAAASGTWRLEGCTLVASLEPCPMCAGALVSARVARVVFGAWDPKMGGCGSVWDIPRDRHVTHTVEVIGGVLAQEAAAALREFFARLR